MYNVADIRNKVFQGDSLTVLKEFPSNSIDLVVTSPPYYLARDYKHNQQIGNERTVQDYINNLFLVFKECKRVLKRTGSMWINISDGYNDKGSLRGVPERLRLQLQDDLDLILRNTIIWFKPSCMPSSAKTRFTVDYELFYFFTKEQDYYFETQYEPMKTDMSKEYKGVGIKDYNSNNVQNSSDVKRRIIENWNKKMKFGGNKYPNEIAGTYSGKVWIPNENLERIKRTVWAINTNSSTDDHFATYPEELIEVPIKACTKKKDSIVLDPFCGSGTTAIKARKMKRNYCAIELSQKYCDIINRRLGSMIETYIK